MKLALLVLAAIPLFGQYRNVLDHELPLYGHRNWIVIADSAYPLQSGPGIQTVLSSESQIETVRHVLNAINKSTHVRPVIFVDKELAAVPEEDAVGIGAYRQLLTGIIGDKVNRMNHEDIIHKLDEAGKTFNVLIIKTNMTIPYTSVFIQLSAAYWSDEAEKRLRQALH